MSGVGYENFLQIPGVSGLMELNTALDDFDEALTEEIITALQRGGMIIEKEAKHRCPVDTGRLRASIYFDVERTDTRQFVLTIGAGDKTKTTAGVERRENWLGKSVAKYGIGSNVEYASYVEYGTSRMAARPFFRPAIDEKAAEAVDEIRETIRELIAGRLIR